MVDANLANSRGMVRIPVCSIDEVRTTIMNDDSNAKGNLNYPCPAIDISACVPGFSSAFC